MSRDNDPSAEKPDTSSNAYTKLMRAANSVNEFIRRKVKLPPFMQGSGFPIMEVLLHKGPLCQNEISQKILRTTGNISQAIDKLEGLGMVSRLEGVDRRSYRVDLTAQGRVQIEAAFSKVQDAIAEALSPLEPSERDSLGFLCKKLGLALKDR